MKLSQVHLAILVIFVLCILNGVCANVAAHRRYRHHGNDVSNDVEMDVEKDHKLLVECQHEDYRTYIKCLKREKRQHFDELGKSL